jgi:RNA polymerase primary sigma factor
MQEQVIMPRIVLDKTRFRVLGNLILQLRFGAPETLLEQSYRAERLIRLINPDKQYPYDFICYKLTDYKPKEIPDSPLIDGADLIADLAMFISQVTRGCPVLPNMLPERGILIERLMAENEISARSMERWIARGLVQRTIIRPEGGLGQIVLESTWQWFIEKNERLVSKAAAMNQLTCEQRRRIVQHARELYHHGGMSRSAIEQFLAKKHARAPETIRFILDAHDQQAEFEERIFPIKTKLTDEVIGQIYELYVKGAGIDYLAKIFGRNPATISRIVNQVRRERWQNVTIEYIYSPEFDLPDAMETIVAPARMIDLKVESAGEHRTEVLSGVQERTLFRAYNYLKWLMDRSKRVENQETLTTAAMDRLEELLNQANQIKDLLIMANRALIAHIAKKHLNGVLSLEELMSEGLGPLIKAVEKFDYTRGFKFSTYASWAIIKHFARAVPMEGQLCHQYLTDEDLDAIMPGVDGVDEDQAYRRSMAVVDAMLQLNERERHILENRFGIDRQQEPMSLAQLGEVLGVTKERVRQIEAKAMDKLHVILKESLAEEVEKS